MKADGYVTPQRAVLDPQGQAIHGVLKRMQYSGLEDVPQGKYFQPLYPRPDHQNQSLSLFRATRLVGNAMRIEEFGEFDFVFGSMILHHLEPFRDFAAALRRTLPVNGKAFFYENNAASDVLVWFRNKVVGKFWVPKYGDKDEFPLTLQEIRTLRELFNVDIQYPEMMFFQLASTYLFKERFGSEMQAVDNFLYKRKVGVKYSYRQYVLLETPPIVS